MGVIFASTLRISFCALISQTFNPVLPRKMIGFRNRRAFMSESQIEDIKAQLHKQTAEFDKKILSLSNEMNELRDGYALVNKRYVASLGVLHDLTLKSSEAAKRSARAAELAREAAKQAAQLALDTGNQKMTKASVIAASSAAAAAESAAESAATAAAGARSGCPSAAGPRRWHAPGCPPLRPGR